MPAMIKTPRLLIKPWTAEDAEAFYELSLDAGFTLFPINVYTQSSVESAKEWIKNSAGKYSVKEIDSGKLLGMGGLTPWLLNDEALIDITYRLRESAWGKGYGMELARALVEYGFNTLKLPEITATITPDNIASKAIAAKLGFKFDKHIILKSVPTDLYRLGAPPIS